MRSKAGSERLCREIFPVKSNDRPLPAFRVVNLLDVQLEINGANNAISEFFVNQCLQRRAIYLNNFVEAVDRWIGWNASLEATSQGNRFKQPDLFFIEAKALAHLFSCFPRKRVLAQDCCCDKNDVET